MRKLSKLFEQSELQMTYAKVAQLVECNLAKVDVAGSSPVFRSIFKLFFRDGEKIVI